MSHGNQAQANPPSQGPSTLTFVPQPPPLELADAENLSTTWRTWKRRWDAFAAVSELNANQDDEYKTGMLVSVADDETLKVIDSLPYVASGDRKKIDKIIELLEKHCLQDVNILFERHRFYRRVQKDGESIDKFARELRMLARTCEFTEDGKDFTEQMVRDRLVCGVSENSVQQKLLAKDNPTLSACIKICRATAAVSSQASEMKAAMSSMVKPEPVDNGYDSTSSRLSLARVTQQTDKRARHTRISREWTSRACGFCNEYH